MANNPEKNPTVDGSGKSQLLKFGSFTLDLQRHGLYLGTTRVHLTSKPFETLAVLVEHRGEVVGKQKLLDAVWKDAFVTEDSLVKAVREIRRALDDEKSSPQFIQTVPGEGYRFIADVTALNPVIEHQPTTEKPAAEVKEPPMPLETTAVMERARGQDLGLGIWTAVALLTVVAVAILWRPWRKPEATTQRHIATVSTLSTAASFSPDSTWITFIKEDVKGVAQVWIQNLAHGEPIPITFGDVPASRPRWSSKNEEIVFGRVGESESIWSKPAFGSLAPTRLIEDGRNPSWSRDGTRLVFERGEDIWTANADGSNQQRVDGVARSFLRVVDREPCFSPDGSEIAYFQRRDGPMGDIWVVPAGGGEPKRLTFDNQFGGGLAWMPDGNYIVFSSQRGGSKTLWKIHRSGGMPEPVLKGPGEDTNPEISRDGKKLIYTSARNLWVLTVVDMASGRLDELWETITDMFFPTFSPQGDRIAFFATVDGGDTQLFTIRTDGEELTQVTRSKGERNNFPRWSADGSTLYYYQVRPDLSFRKISSAGGTSSEIVPDWAWKTHNAGRVAPNGEKIIYSRMENGKPVETLVWDMETGSESIFKPTLDDTQWSDDGKYIVGTENPSGLSLRISGDIMVCPVDTVGTCRRVATKGHLPIWPGDNSRIYFARWKSSESKEIWSVSPEGKDEKRFIELLHMDQALASYDVSSKGQAVYVQFKPGKQELWIMDFPE